MAHYLQELIRRYKAGTPQGIFSVCSANEFVIEALLEFGKKHGEVVLVEATCNQVNQFGGYTGMAPADFVKFVDGIGERVGFPKEKVLLGGDHLGPNPWKGEPKEEAMAKAEALVREYVRAGFTKIHLDASMHLGGDGSRSVPWIPLLLQNGLLGFARPEEGLPGTSCLCAPMLNGLCTSLARRCHAQWLCERKRGMNVTAPEDFHATVRLTRKPFLGTV